MRDAIADDEKSAAALADEAGRNGASAGERVLARGESSYQSLLVTESGEGDDRLRTLKVNESL
ncbi:MAG: hypothetical protein VW453_04605, partial [Rhodospirillaceae bacterium]